MWLLFCVRTFKQWTNFISLIIFFTVTASRKLSRLERGSYIIVWNFDINVDRVINVLFTNFFYLFWCFHDPRSIIKLILIYVLYMDRHAEFGR